MARKALLCVLFPLRTRFKGKPVSIIPHKW